MPLRRIKAAWQDIFTPKPEARKALGWIRERHTLWIMSDTDPLHFTALLSCCEALKLADRYVLSYEQGYLKQESESFRALLADSGRNPGEFILIDDREENCRCAASMGIRSLLFRNWAQTIETLSET